MTSRGVSPIKGLDKQRASVHRKRMRNTQREEEMRNHVYRVGREKEIKQKREGEIKTQTTPSPPPQKMRGRTFPLEPVNL